ncbi:MAG: 3-phosphoserine/phosphohydroxythreonine transaminase [Saprospiraceae bacterium]|nr:3-phosphoserine/phosphohydroxythreonine transaminase [Saprospiraceae bacterium]
MTITATNTKHNFSAGPAILPKEVFTEAAQACVDFNGTGLSLLEMSHRGADFVAVMDEALALVREILELPDNYHVLFVGGGASSQFYNIPMNLLNDADMAAYVNTGTWASNAIKEAKAFGQIEVVASSESDQFRHVPKGYPVPADAKYLHLTSNNTIYGTQLFDWPETKVPLVCDMSSDIFSRPVPIERFGMIYAGAQKNMGPAGVTLVIVRDDMLGHVKRHIPTMLDYRTHIKKGSMYNTPPVFPIYVSMLTMRWVRDQGGLDAMEARNFAKAQALYAEIDRNPLFKGTTAVDDRSWMNATFVLEDDTLNEAFLTDCKAAGIVGLKGHRSVGGFRASMYNALDLASVQALVDVMQIFEKKHG